MSDKDGNSQDTTREFKGTQIKLLGKASGDYRAFNVIGLNNTSMTQLNILQLCRVTQFEKDEVLVTTLFCRMFNVNGFNNTAMILSGLTSSVSEKDEVLVTTLFCRMFNVNGFNTQA